MIIIVLNVFQPILLSLSQSPLEYHNHIVHLSLWHGPSQRQLLIAQNGGRPYYKKWQPSYGSIDKKEK